MTEQLHITQCDDPTYLPFAKSRIKAMRATGQKFLSQKFDVGGVRVDVRIEGEHSFVSIGGKPGKYLCLPHSTAHPDGVLTAGTPPAPVPPSAVLRLSSTGGAPKLDEHVGVHTGTNDWRGGKKDDPRIITFDASYQRYNYTGEPLEQPGIYDNGATIPTRITLPGVGEVNCGVLGACIINGGDRSFYVMATTAKTARPLRRTIYICYRTEGEWELIDSIDVPEHWDAYSPVIFSPDGSKFNTILRLDLMHADADEMPARKVSGTLIVQKDGDVVTVVAAHTTTDIPDTSVSVEAVPEPAPEVTIYAVSHVEDWAEIYSYERGVETFTWSTTTGWLMQHAESAGTFGLRLSYTYPIAYDYDDQGAEIPVTLRFLAHEQTTFSSDSVSYHSLGTDPALNFGGFTHSYSGEPGNGGAFISYARVPAESGVNAWAVGVNATTHSTYQGTYEFRIGASIYFGPVCVSTTTQVLFNQSWDNQSRYEQGIIPWGSYFVPDRVEVFTGSASHTYETTQYLALDARVNAVLSVTINSYADSATDTISIYGDDCTRSVDVDMSFGARTKKKSWVYPRGLPIFSTDTYSNLYYRFLFFYTPGYVSPRFVYHSFLDFSLAMGNYASRDGKTFAFSASPDTVGLTSEDSTGVNSLPETGESVTWFTGDAGSPGRPFSIGGEGNFAINPITIF